MKFAVYILILFACTVALAQPSGNASRAASAPAAAPQATAGATQDDQAFADSLRQMRASAQKSDSDVARLRLEKWKVDAVTKQQTQASAESIRHNLTYAMPDLLLRIEASPGSLNANFRLYRNLNALYDTFSALVESAVAFGARDQYDPLAADITQLDRFRHQMAERVDLLAGNNDAELARLRAKLATSTAGPKPASKVIVNNDDSPKPKKKPKPAPTPTSTPDK